MNVALHIRAYVFRSATAAVLLAAHDPAKHYLFAKKLIAAKNLQVNSSMANAVTKLITMGELRGPELCKIIDMGERTRNSRSTASKSDFLLVERFKRQSACELDIRILSNKQYKYVDMEWALGTMAGKSLAHKTPQLPPRLQMAKPSTRPQQPLTLRHSLIKAHFPA
jgi:hypothetical protein